MRKILASLLALGLLLMGLAAAGAEGSTITLEITNAAKLPLYAADDPWISQLRHGAEPADSLQVLVVPVKKGIQLQTSIQPASVKNKRVTLTVDRPEYVRVQGNSLSGLVPGEAVLTVASQENPDAKAQFRVLVIQQATRLTLSAAEKSVPVGGTLGLTAVCAPENTTFQAVTWSSADERIATVDQNGVVTGVKRGNVRIMAVTQDGSNVRANLNVQVAQPAVGIQLNDMNPVVDVGRNTVLKATVLPNDANDKKVIWTSSNESIAKVNNQGRVTGVALGECEIICTSASNGQAVARATVHVQQPVTKITFGDAPAVYAGETAQLTWAVEPASASNAALKLTSGNERILRVTDDGTIIGISAGETYVNAVSTDGSNRRARVKVKVYAHVTGVRMVRDVAYIDVGQTNTTGATLQPKTASNRNMVWSIADPSVASVVPLAKEPNRVKITGLQPGTTTLTGTTVDGGYQASMTVNVGHYDDFVSLRDAWVQNEKVFIVVRNESDLNITSVTAEVSVLDSDGNALPVGKNGATTFRMVYQKTLRPGKSSSESDWKYVDYVPSDSPAVSRFVVKIVQFQIENDWVKTITRKNQPTRKISVHL